MISFKKALVLCLVLFVGYVSLSDDEFARSVRSFFVNDMAGETAPGFVAPDLYGHAISLSAYKGKVVLLTFWTTWCPTCQKQMGSVDEVSRTWGYHNFAVITVCLDEASSGDISNYVNGKGYTFTTLYDPQSIIGKKYGVRAYPTSYIIDEKGVIVEKVVGSVNWARGRYADKLLKLINY